MTSAFFVLILLAFSDEVASAAKLFTLPYSWAAPLYLACDFLILMLLLWQRRRIRRATGQPKARNVTFSWWLGFVLMLLADAYWLDPFLPVGQLNGLLLAFVYIALMAVLFAATIGVSPRMFVAPSRRGEGWEDLKATIPLLVGIFAAYLASNWWDTMVEPRLEWGLAGELPPVDDQFFAQASQVLPFLIVALGFSIGAFDKVMVRETQRAAAVVSLTFLGAGEVLALTVLVQPERAAVLHAYSALVVVMIAGFIGLTTLVGALLAESRERTRKDESPKVPEPAPTKDPGWHQAVAIGVLATAVAAFVLRRRDQR